MTYIETSLRGMSRCVTPSPMINGRLYCGSRTCGFDCRTTQIRSLDLISIPRSSKTTCGHLRSSTAGSPRGAYLSPKDLPDHQPSWSPRSLALPKIRRNVNTSPGSVPRRRWEISFADSDRFLPDLRLRPSAPVGSSESSWSVVITPAEVPVAASTKVRTRRPAYRLAAAMPTSLEACTDFWAA